MTDVAPQRARHPFRPVMTVGQLLGRPSDPLPGTPNGRTGGSPEVPNGPISVSTLIRRAGYDCELADQSVEPRFDRTFTGLTTPHRRLLTSAGAVLAVGSLAGAAIMLGDVRPGPATAGATDAGYPGQRLPQRAGAPADQTPFGGLTLDLATVASASPLAPAGVGLPAAALSSGVLPSLPAGTGVVPAPRAGGFGPSSGGVVGAAGGVVGGVVRSGGGLVGGTVDGVGRSLGSVGTPVRALGDTVTRTTVALDDTVTGATGSLGVTVASTLDGVADVGGERRAADGPSTATGPALSSLTAPITARDAIEGPVNKLVGGSGSSDAPSSHARSSRDHSPADRAEVGSTSPKQALRGLGGLAALGSAGSDDARSGTRAKARGERRSVDGLLSAASSPLSKKRSTSSEKRSGASEKRSSGKRSSTKRSGSLVDRLTKATERGDKSEKRSGISKKRTKDSKKRSGSSKSSTKKSSKKSTSKRSGGLRSALSGRD